MGRVREKGGGVRGFSLKVENKERIAYPRRVESGKVAFAIFLNGKTYLWGSTLQLHKKGNTHAARRCVDPDSLE